jgi:two-component system cell cycle response regulator CtrA
VTALFVGVDHVTTEFAKSKGLAVESVLPDEGFDVKDWLTCGQEYEAVVLDLAAVGLGDRVCRGLRLAGAWMPIVGIRSLVEGESWSEIRSLFLENGGDDLLRHPASPRELVASVQAAIRRVSNAPNPVVEVSTQGTGRITINTVNGSVVVNGVTLRLTRRQVALLLVLARNAGRVVTKQALLDAVYVDGVDDQPCIKIVDVFLCKIRSALREAGADGVIRTVWGKGYMLGEPRD